MPSLSQLSAASGRRLRPMNDAMLLEAQIPGAFAIKQRQLEADKLAAERVNQEAQMASAARIQAENADIARQGVSAQERAAGAQRSALSQGTLVSGAGTALQAGMLANQIFPGKLASLGKSLYNLIPGTSTGAAEAAGIGGAAAGLPADAAAIGAGSAEAAGLGATAGAGGLLSTIGSVAGPIGAGFAGAKLLPMLFHGAASKNVAGLAGGIGTGALVGSYLWPGVGTALGAAAGALSGVLGLEKAPRPFQAPLTQQDVPLAVINPNKWSAPEHTLDPATGVTYRYTSSGRRVQTGNISQWSPEDQAEVRGFLTRGGPAGGAGPIPLSMALPGAGPEHFLDPASGRTFRLTRSGKQVDTGSIEGYSPGERGTIQAYIDRLKTPEPAAGPLPAPGPAPTRLPPVFTEDQKSRGIVPLPG